LVFGKVPSLFLLFLHRRIAITTAKTMAKMVRLMMTMLIPSAVDDRLKPLDDDGMVTPSSSAGSLFVHGSFGVELKSEIASW
jgi:hypothetical protein